MINLNNDILTQYIHEEYGFPDNYYVYSYLLKNQEIHMNINFDDGSIAPVGMYTRLDRYNRWIALSRTGKIDQVIDNNHD